MQPKKNQTIVQYLVEAIASLGIDHCFGVPGDYSFSLSDAFYEPDSPIKWVGCCNELNAGYAADGYARLRGFACLCTTYSVGELSALNAVAAAYAESCPVIHIVGMPSLKLAEKKAIMHHCIGSNNWDYGVGKKIYESVTCASALLTPKNAAFEIHRVLQAAYRERKPVYIVVPNDYANAPIEYDGSPLLNITEHQKSDPGALDAVIAELDKMINNAESAVLLPGHMINRLQITDLLQKVVDRYDFPFATMLMDKSCLSEEDKHYIGVYDGTVPSSITKEYVENCDLVVSIGALFTDINTGMFSTKLVKEKLVDIQLHYVKIGYVKYDNVEMIDVLKALITNLKISKDKKFVIDNEKLRTRTLREIVNVSSDKKTFETRCHHDDPCAPDSIKSDELFVYIEEFLRSDIIVAETGTALFGLGMAKLKKHAYFISETLYSSIGYTLPAAFGAGVELLSKYNNKTKSLAGETDVQISEKDRRIVLVIGDGSFQMTAQEFSSFSPNGLKPIVILIDNDGYTVERMLCKPASRDLSYNGIVHWNYEKLPELFGCADKWDVKSVDKRCHLIQALHEARENTEKASLIVVKTEIHCIPKLLDNFIKNRVPAKK